MQYGIYNRPRLPRNRYGYDNMYDVGNYSSNSLFGTNEAAAQVGADMSALSVFYGASDDADGMKGLVPAPLAGQQDYFLKGDGAWEFIPAYRWMSEYPTDEGLKKSGLQVNGDFHVTDTLSTMNLNVEGQAHFWELVIDKAKMQGGQIFVSPSLFQIDAIDILVEHYINDSDECFKMIHQERPDIWKFLTRYHFTNCRCRRLWMQTNDNQDRTYNEVKIGDMLRCRTFNLEGQYSVTGVYKDVYNTDYWSFAVATGEGYFVDDNGNTQEGVYIDMAFAFTGSDPVWYYVPLNTYFQDSDAPIIQNDNFVMPNVYDELKEWTYNTLCGSTNVVSEYIEDQDDIDRITDYDFRIRGVGYIISKMLGVEYEDDTLSSLYDLLEANGLLEHIVEGDENDNATQLINQITGQEAYDGVTIYTNPYAYEIAEVTANGGYVEMSEDAVGEPNIIVNEYPVSERGFWQFGFGIFDPRKGQQLGCLGHLWDKTRQNAIVISAMQPIDTELVAPAIAQYDGIDVFGASISNFRMNCLAKNGNVFTGKFMIREENAYVSIEDKIELYIKDIETGLETVGIHLDGDKSTIKMVGSVELHQHDNKDNDTLSVWDSSGNKKVEIIPSEIPSLGNLDQTSTTVYDSYTNYYTKFVGQDYIQEARSDKRWHNPFTYYYQYEYRISSYSLQLKNTITLGSYKKGMEIDVNNAQMFIYLGRTGFRDAQDRDLLTNGTSYSWQMKLYAGSTAIKDLTGTGNMSDGMNTFSIALGQVCDDYKPTHVDSRKYKLDITITFNVRTLYSDWNNTRYIDGARYYYIYPKCYSQCSVHAVSTGANFMQIGTNGMVYSVGTGDYFYSGNDGMALNYKENGLMLTNNGMKLYKKPQTITSSSSSKQIKSELVICTPSSSGYHISVPGEYYETGQTVTIIGFKGLIVDSSVDRRFKVFRYDVNNWATAEYVNFNNKVEYHQTTSSTSPYLDIYSPSLQFVVGADGLYIISSLSV